MRVAVGVVMVAALGFAGWMATRPTPPPSPKHTARRFDWPPAKLRVSVTPAAGASFAPITVVCPLKRWDNELVWRGSEQGVAVRVALAARDEGTEEGADVWEVSIGLAHSWAKSRYDGGVSFKLRGLSAGEAGLGPGKLDITVEEQGPVRPAHRRDAGRRRPRQ
jgi:hypothetical protein